MESKQGVPRKALDAVIGLGANLGSPEIALLQALSQLARFGSVLAVSSLYKTLPVGGPPQPDFLNAAARLLYEGSPRALLEHLLELERQAGRARRERWGPRTLDLDILWLNGVALRAPGLEVPHPRLRERAFALRPLLDVAPEAADPSDGTPYARVLAELGSAGVEELGRAWVSAGAADLPAGMDRPSP
jgi:2-amino-4-hydroxy-6-hydroxymethyldihydropteridine diphosphokinase